MAHDHAAQPEADHEFNPVDPHGHHERIHHHVYSWQFLTVVLLILLFFTFLTIVVSNAESWLVKSIAITIPDYVNALIAMFIATIKATFVLLFFMGLRRGNPMNGMIFLFTLFAFAMFLGFTALDLLNRGHVYEYKGQSIVAGGTGAGIVLPDGTSFSGPITAHAREQKILKLMAEGDEKHPGPMSREDAEHIWKDHYYEGYEKKEATLSTANQHIRRTGLTPGLFIPAEHNDSHAADEHATDHSDASKPDHDQPAANPH